jgi:hypothetical protein
MEVTVNHNGKVFKVLNSAADLGAIEEIVTANESLIVKTTEIGDGGFDPAAEVGKMGIVKSILRMSTTGKSFGDFGKNEAISAPYDERKMNNAGFSDYLKRIIINATFMKYQEIEPLKLDGTVKVEFQ